MRFENEFTVDTSVERAWATLLEIDRVAEFLPGAAIERREGDGVYHGTMRLKVGPMTVQYRGTARLVAADETEHISEIALEAREAKGQGTVAATLRNRLVPEDTGTRVIVETDMNVTGRQAQFGRGVMQEVAARMLTDFAGRFEEFLVVGPDAETGGPNAGTSLSGENGSTASAPIGRPAYMQEEAGGLDVLSLVLRTPTVQRTAAALLAAILAALLVRWRRRS